MKTEHSLLPPWARSRRAFAALVTKRSTPHPGRRGCSDRAKDLATDSQASPGPTDSTRCVVPQLPSSIAHAMPGTQELSIFRSTFGHRVRGPLDTSTHFANPRLNRCPMEFAPPESTESPLSGLGVRNRTGVRGFSAPCSAYVASNPSRPSMLQRFFSDQ